MRIHLVGSIDEDSYLSFSRKLAKLENEQQSFTKNSKVPVEVLLMSCGGDAYTGLAFFDRVKKSSLPVYITGTGIIASAATIILAAGHKRRMTANAWLMVHEDSAPTVKHMAVTHAEVEMAQSRAMENQWNYLLQSTTHLTADQWDKMNKTVTYLDANQCLEAGLIEEIV